jgi:hypothetical protein
MVFCKGGHQWMLSAYVSHHALRCRVECVRDVKKMLLLDLFGVGMVSIVLTEINLAVLNWLSGSRTSHMYSASSTALLMTLMAGLLPAGVQNLCVKCLK